MIEWAQSLTPTTASFLGSLTGASIGLIAILFGALFNAHLNRRRDDRLRKAKTQAMAVALTAELTNITDTLNKNSDKLGHPEKKNFLVPNLDHQIHFFPEIIPKIGNFDTFTVRMLMDSYVLISQYGEELFIRGGRLFENNLPDRNSIQMPISRVADVIEINRQLAEKIEAAISKLRKYC